MAPTSPIPTTFNVASYHLKLTQDKKQFKLGKKNVTNQLAFAPCLVTKATWDDQTNTCDITLIDGTAIYDYTKVEHFKTKDQVPPVGSVVEFVFTLSIDQDTLESTCDFHSLEVIHQPNKSMWSAQSEKFLGLLEDHWEECKQFYKKYCSLPTDSIANFSTPYDFLLLTIGQLQHSVLVQSRPGEGGEMNNNDDNNNNNFLSCHGVDVTNRLALVIATATTNQPCSGKDDCPADCTTIDFKDASCTVAQHFQPTSDTLCIPPQSNTTCLFISQLFLKQHDDTDQHIFDFDVMLCTALVDSEEEGEVERHAENALDFVSTLERHHLQKIHDLQQQLVTTQMECDILEQKLDAVENDEKIEDLLKQNKAQQEKIEHQQLVNQQQQQLITAQQALIEQFAPLTVQILSSTAVRSTRPSKKRKTTHMLSQEEQQQEQQENAELSPKSLKKHKPNNADGEQVGQQATDVISVE